MHSAARVLRAGVLVLLAALVSACPGGGGESPDTVSLTLIPTTVSLETGANTTFRAEVSGTDNKAVTWSVEEGQAGGRVNTEGVYTAPSAAGTYHVVATSAADASKSARATVTVTAPRVVSVSISPAQVTLAIGTSQPFSATVTGADNTAVTWSVEEGAAGGSVSAAGLYTAPSVPGTYHVVAQSVADATKSARATVTVVEGAITSVSIDPKQVTLGLGGSQGFSATVAGTGNTAVTWSVQEGRDGGTITPDGVYTAPGTPGTYHVVAQSVADATRRDTATVVVSASPIVSVVISPRGAILAPGTTQAFTTLVSGTTNKAVTWSVAEGSAGGSITPDGIYIAPSTLGTYHVVATSVADATKSDRVAVKVTSGTIITVSLSPLDVTLAPTETQRFTATVKGSTNTAVRWSVLEGAAGGSISAEGLYTAPDTTGEFHVVASSVADGTRAAVATVRVVRSISVSVSPSPVTVTVGGTQSFEALVSGTTNTAVTWSVLEGSAGGAISTSGVYVAPTTPGTYHVVATSVADPSKSATATVNVVARPVVSVAITPIAPSLRMGATQQFSAQVSGTSDTRVTWTVLQAQGGTISSSGLYTAPATPGTYHVVATSVADPSKSATATVRVLGALNIVIAPGAAGVLAGSQQTFTAFVSGAFDPRVTWSVQEGAAGGTITPDGLYTAPSTEGVYHVVATSVEDATKSASVPVSVSFRGGASMIISPSAPTVVTGELLGFTAFAMGVSVSSQVRWDVIESEGGSIDRRGLYVAPSIPGTYHVLASSELYSGGTVEAIATVTVVEPQAVDVSLLPARVQVTTGKRQSFTASVAGTSNTALTWSVVGGAANGTITAEGIYTAPFKVGTVTVRATSVADPTKFAEAQVQVVNWNVDSYVLSPATVSLVPGDYHGFSLTSSAGSVSGHAVAWSVLEGSAGGWVDRFGTYHAPKTPGTYHVVGGLDPVYAPYGEEAGYAVATIHVRPSAEVTVSVVPGAVRLQPGAQQSLTAQVLGSEQRSVTWSVVGGAVNGTIDANGVYTAPGAPGVYTVRATSVADPSKSDTAEVTVTWEKSSSTLIISPAVVTVPAYSSFSLTASAGGVSSTALDWRVLEGSIGGSVTPEGVYLASPTPGEYTVVGSRLDVSNNAIAYAYTLVRVLPPQAALVSVWPTQVKVPAGGIQSFTARVAGDASAGITWSSSAGGISQDGRFLAPSASGRYTVTATSVSDPTKKATAQVEVTSASASISVAVSPTTITLAPGDLAAFQASISGPTNVSYNGVWWRPLDLALFDNFIPRDRGLDLLAPSAPGVYLVHASHWDGSSMGSALVSVHVLQPQGVSVRLAPAPETVPTGARHTFTANVAGSANPAVTWSATGGSIDANGTFTTPSTPGRYTVTATSVADPTKKDSAVVDVVDTEARSMAVQPAVVRLRPGGAVALEATVFGTFFSRVDWDVAGGAVAGTVGRDGVYRAPWRPGVYRVAATDYSSVTPVRAFVTVIVE